MIDWVKEAWRFVTITVGAGLTVFAIGGLAIAVDDAHDKLDKAATVSVRAAKSTRRLGRTVDEYVKHDIAENERIKKRLDALEDERHDNGTDDESREAANHIQ